MQNLLQRLTGFIGGLLSGAGLTGLTENLVTLGLVVFAVSLGFFAIYYLTRRRQTLDQERMAALIKGLHYAGVSQQLLDTVKADAKDQLARGLRWLFAALGLSSALFCSAKMQPDGDVSEALRAATVGLVPASIGVAHMLSSWMTARQQRRAAAVIYRPVPRRRLPR
jgi:uncharacterized protein DUF6249